MEKQFFAAAAIALFAAGPVHSQNVAAPSAALSTNSTCDQWGLSAKDLAECRAQWKAAPTDVERQRIKAAYQNRGTLGGTPLGSAAPAGQLNGPGPAGRPIAPDEGPGVKTTPPISGNGPAAPPAHAAPLQ
jgi:hypothetical protein